jgi:methylornithine synthase
MFANMDKYDLDTYAQKIINGMQLSEDDLRKMLSIEDSRELEKLHYVARKIRDHYFGNKVFLYSFVYFSTYCKNRCAFCYYNTLNKIHRYRLGLADIRNICRRLKGEQIHMVDLTMGEDPYFHENPDQFAKVIDIVKEELALPVMISPGVMDDKTLLMLREHGADFLALYQETYDKELYKNLRVGQSFSERIHARQFAQKIGYCVEDGMLTGVGNDVNSTIISLKGMAEQNPQMVRVMTFIPQEGTPMEKKVQETNISELKIISVLRLMFPDKLIPASLDVEGIEGMVYRLNAGANVVTSIIPSDSFLEGVANYDRKHEERKRDPRSVVEKLKSMGLEPAAQSDFNKILRVMA